VLKGIFEKIGLFEERAYQLFQTFAMIDNNENGFVDSMECRRYFKHKSTKFTERIFFFEIRESTNNNNHKIRRAMTFQEFAIRIWSFASLTKEQLARYLFEIFDIDNQFYLHKRSIYGMIRMLYDNEQIDENYVSLLYTYDEQGFIAKSQFIQQSMQSSTFTMIINVVWQFQQLLRKKTGGRRMWQLITSFRESHFGIKFDSELDTLQEAEIAILRAAENDDYEEQQNLKPPAPEQFLIEQNYRLLYEVEMTQREIQLQAKQQLIQEHQLALFAPDKNMKEKWKKCENYETAFLAEEFTTLMSDVLKRKEMRMQMFILLEEAIQESRDYYLWKDEVDEKTALGTNADHELRYHHEILSTPTGQQFQLLIELIFILRKCKEEMDLKNSKNKKFDENKKPETLLLLETNLKNLEKMLDIILPPSNEEDPIINNKQNSKINNEKEEEEEKQQENHQTIFTISLTEQDKQLTILARKDLSEEFYFAKKNCKNSKLWELALNEAHNFLVDFHQNRFFRLFQENLFKEQQEREREYIRKEWKLISNYGSKITQWEYVLDKEQNKPCYISSVTGQRRHPKTAFCEKCDAIMIQHELRCIECDAPRSAKNLLLYRPLGFKDITLE
jgi:hypothetical protein